VDDVVADRMLRLVGLGVRSRGVVVGVDQVRDAVKRGKIMIALVAADASKHSISKVVPLLEARGVRVVHCPSAAQLGRAVGREQTAAVGVLDRQLARGIRELMDSAPSGSQEE
jgi:ribosomal protein L7Ae-like RNA K-turn-binding protein